MTKPSKKTDTLVKPDMQAVLSRTHLANNLHGFLLPIFESISNAMDGIESRFGEAAANKGEIKIKFSKPNDPNKILISVLDNGVGLTEDNYNSFRTPFSGYKLKLKGRGFGRFIAFKVFNRVLYSSRHKFFC
jgi:sensor histidine kinase regulating citrate/malate metabolism